MQFARRPLGRVAFIVLIALAALSVVLNVKAAEKARIQVDDYQIEAAITPKTHRLQARSKVKFTALDDISVATFELHNALRPTRVVDAEGHTLSIERVSQDSTVRVQLPAGLTKGQSTTLTFDYEGALNSADDSPVQGLKLASIADPISYLLYAGRWFPMVGYGTDRFTASIRLIVPNDYTVIGSGRQNATAELVQPSDIQVASGTSDIGHLRYVSAFQESKSEASKPEPKKSTKRPVTKKEAAPPKNAPASADGPFRHAGPGEKEVNFVWTKPGFPGTIIAGQFTDTKVSEAGLDVHVYFTHAKKQYAGEYGTTAAKEFAFFTGLYGVTGDTNLNVVELADDTVPTAYAPEVVAISARNISEKANYRLLANAVAHQWWGVLVSPASKNDWWITDGLARYSEARYIEQVAGKSAFSEATKDMSVGALAYETVPLSQAGTLDTFDPTFQSLVTDKGGMIFHMLRWVIGDANFDKMMRQVASEYSGKPISIAELRGVSEKITGDQLTWFYSQWLDSTGAPEFKNKYTVYRTPKGFRVVGEIQQDLDLFRMPVELKIDTDGQTEMKRIEVVGTNSNYAVETFGKPRRITIDPGNDVLKNSGDLKVRTAIMRGQQLIQQNDLAGALKEFQKALDSNKNSSLAHYRVAEVFFLQHNYQAAANAYREALNGDADPRWTEVWSHIQLGKIFDITGQRERATNEYRQALQTNDNTQNALDEARRYLQSPYQQKNETRNGD